MEINLNDDFIKSKLKLLFRDFPQRNFQKHQIEEIAFRMYLCKSCFENNECPHCSCNPLDKMSDLYSCNENKKFPKLSSTPEEWESFKKQKNILIT